MYGRRTPLPEATLVDHCCVATDPRCPLGSPEYCRTKSGHVIPIRAGGPPGLAAWRIG